MRGKRIYSRIIAGIRQKMWRRRRKVECPRRPLTKFLEKSFSSGWYLRHETTEKRDRVDSYQPYLPVAWVKQTRCSCWRGGRGADYVCWWSQHSHQTLEAFNFRQRFGNFSFVVCFVKVTFCFSLHVKIVSPWLFFASVFTSFSHDFLGRYANSCVIFFRAIRCYTSASFFLSLLFFRAAQNCWRRADFFSWLKLWLWRNPLNELQTKIANFHLIFSTVFDLRKKMYRETHSAFDSAIDSFFSVSFCTKLIANRSGRRQTRRRRKGSLDVDARVHFLARCATKMLFLHRWLSKSRWVICRRWSHGIQSSRRS